MQLDKKVINKANVQMLAKSSNESFARVTVSGFLVDCDLTISDLSDIKTAVSEAVTNCIVHSYYNMLDKEKIIELDLLLYEEVDEIIFKISVKDYGLGIEDVDLARTPLYTKRPEDERSGMGFTIMEAFMDSLEVTTKINEGTIVTMTKNLSKH